MNSGATIKIRRRRTSLPYCTATMASTSALPSTPPNQWTVHFTAKGSNQALTMPRDITVAELLQRILAITNAIPTSFRVLCGGVLIKATAGVDEIALEKYSGLKDGVKVQVMGDELDLLVGVPAETRDLWREAAKQLTENKSSESRSNSTVYYYVAFHLVYYSRAIHYILLTRLVWYGTLFTQLLGRPPQILSRQSKIISRTNKPATLPAAICTLSCPL